MSIESLTQASKFSPSQLASSHLDRVAAVQRVQVSSKTPTYMCTFHLASQYQFMRVIPFHCPTVSYSKTESYLINACINVGVFKLTFCSPRVHLRIEGVGGPV